MRVFNSRFSFLLVFLIVCTLQTFSQTASFTPTSTSGCAPFSVQFTNTSTAGGPYSWDLGNGNTSTNTNASAVYNNPGTFTVVLTAGNGSTATGSVTVFQKPSASFSLIDDTICTNGLINFTSTSTQGTGNIVLYIWSFGDGNVDSSLVPTINHTYTIPGGFSSNLVIIDQNNCQSQSTTLQIRAITPPVPNFSTNPTNSCIVPVTVNFTNTTTPVGNYSYQWNFNDPTSAFNTSVVQNPSHQFATANTYNVKLIVTLGGCSDSITKPFSARPVDANFTIVDDTVCIGAVLAFNDASTPTPSSLFWNFNDPTSTTNTSTLSNPTHVYQNAGTYYVFLTSTLGNCVDTITKIVIVKPRPVVTFNTTSDSTNCRPPLNVTFAGVSSGTITNWTWNFGDPGSGGANTAITQSSSHNYTSIGNYSVTLTVTDNFGCTNTFSKPNHIRIVPPTIRITNLPDSGCIGSTFNFASQLSYGPGDTIQSIVWNFGDGTGNITGSNPQSHTFNTTGIFTVHVTLTTRDGCTVTDSIPRLIRIGRKPTADFTWTPSVMCYGVPVFFTDASTIASPETVTGWLWDWGDRIPNPSHVFPDTGVYSVTLIAFSNGCADTITKNNIITINPPKPIFIENFNCSNSHSVQFTDQSHGDTWLRWNFGDGSPNDSTNNQAPVHVFPGRGSYTVVLTAYNSVFGCQFDETHFITITDPVATATASPTQGCAPFTSNFTGSGSQDANTFLWNFADPASGILNSSRFADTLHLFNTTGNYAVTLTITDIHNCTSTINVPIQAQGPTADFTTPNASGCRPFTTTLQSTSNPLGGSIVSYLWNFNFPSSNDLATTTNASIPHTFNNIGIFSIQLIVVDANGCRDTLVKSNYIKSTHPIPNFNGLDTFICDNVSVPMTINLNGESPYTILWNYGDGTPNTNQTNVNGTSSTVLHTYTTNNTLNPLTVTVTDANGCDTTLIRQIKVLHPDPAFTVSTADSCGYTTGNFYGPSPNSDSINQWNWNVFGPFGYTGPSALENPTFQFTIPGYYGATLTVTNPGCSRSVTRDSLFLVPGPQGFFTYVPDTGCSPISVTLNTTILTGTYDFIRWDFGDGNLAETPSPGTSITYTYYRDGVYNPRALIAYTVNGRQCLVSDTNLTGADIIVSTLLSVDATPPLLNIADGSRDTLTAFVTDPANNPPYSYSWNAFPGTASFTPVGGLGSVVQYTASGSNSYVVVTVRDNSGCQAYDTIIVNLLPPEPCISLTKAKEDRKLANVFGPDGNGLNDFFYIPNDTLNLLCNRNEPFYIKIYNRWGKIMFESDNLSFRWYGRTKNDSEASDGTYYYIMTLGNENIKGWIELIRNNK